MIDEITHTVEQGSWRFDLHFASTPKALIHRLANNAFIKDVQEEVRRTPLLVCEFLERAEILFERPCEEGYLHPDDMALCAYVYLIGDSCDNAVQGFVQRVATSPNQSFRGAIGVAKLLVQK